MVHWARVLENGLQVAERNGADREVVALFDLFHDSGRVNEYGDDGHGSRGGEFARSLRGTLIRLDDALADCHSLSVLALRACPTPFSPSDPTARS